MSAPRLRIAALLFCTALAGCGRAQTTAPVTWQAIAAQPVPPADHRLAYGADSLQFGELRLPAGPGPHPVVVLFHGGCWRAQFDLRHVGPTADALTRAGFATWTPEYRRIENPGGGWPGTLADAGAATDFVRTLAERFPLDVGRVVVAGHSAGGQLALWVASRPRLPVGDPLRGSDPLPPRGVVALAAITDLAAYSAGSGSCNGAVVPLMGGTPAEVPERFAAASPVERLPLGVPQRLVHGAADAIVPASGAREYVARARAAGDAATLEEVRGAGHFDVIAPFAPAWRSVVEAVRAMAR